MPTKLRWGESLPGYDDIARYRAFDAVPWCYPRRRRAGDNGWRCYELESENWRHQEG